MLGAIVVADQVAKRLRKATFVREIVKSSFIALVRYYYEGE